MIELSADEFLIAASASEFLQSGEHLPKDVLPRDLSASQEHHKFVDIPVFVGHMLCDNLTININKQI